MEKASLREDVREAFKPPWEASDRLGRWMLRCSKASGKRRLSPSGEREGSNPVKLEQKRRLVSLRSGACHPGTHVGDLKVTAPDGSATSKIPDNASLIECIRSRVAVILSV